MTTLYLVRHGQSLANVEERCAGHTDVDLSGLGVLQAEATARALADVPFTALYSSDLLRAYRTAEAHTVYHPLEVQKNPGLREVCCGDMENLTRAEQYERFPDLMPERWVHGFGTFAFPHGESIPHACARFTATAEEIARVHDGQTVLLASHAAVIRAFYASVMGLAPEEVAAGLPFPSNASYSIVTYDGTRFAPVRYSCDDHLGDMATNITYRAGESGD